MLARAAMTDAPRTPTAADVPDYDEVWDEVYGDLQDVGPVHRHMKRIMRRMLAPLEYSSVLEVGVGFGHNLPLLTAGRKLDRIAGLDLSQRAVEHVRREWGNDFHRLDIEKERLDASFDLVCIPLVMEHVVDDEATLRNLRAMTGRYLLVVTIGGDIERYRPWEKQMGHLRNYRRGELERKLEATGFAVERITYWGFPFYSPIVRTLQNRMTVTHDLSRASKLIAGTLYPVFFLNSHHRGDLIVALARAV
jgi:SAM-dependent methyltransferase